MLHAPLGRLAAGTLAMLAGLVGATSAGATSEPPRPKAIVSGINLTVDDLPGWDHEPPPRGYDQPRKASPDCPRSRLWEADASGSSEAFTKRGPVEVHSQAWVMATQEAAAAEVAAVPTTSSRHCLAKALREGTGETLHVTAVSVRPLKVHPPSTAGLRMRLGYDYRGRHSIAVIDHRWFSYGRAVVLLESSTIRMPYPAAKVDALQTVLLTRAQGLLPGG